ncbi:MAG TPA: TcpE family conjugal transfer membrane protein [Conexibacter sp.]|nr:TcpE family conjugal transfer membrane protein [Conexibacter sp.]
MRGDGMTIRSYGVCFRLERRIHKIDSWRVPLSYGVPVSGLAWTVATLLAVLAAGQLPVVGLVLGAVHPALRLVVVPIAVGWFLSRWRVDGRPALAAGLAYARWQLAPRRLVALRPAPASGPWTLGAVTFAGDGRGARLRPAVVRGPARVVLRYPAELRERGAALEVRPTGGPARWRGTEIVLSAGQRVVVQS